MDNETERENIIFSVLDHGLFRRETFVKIAFKFTLTLTYIFMLAFFPQYLCKFKVIARCSFLKSNNCNSNLTPL